VFSVGRQVADDELAVTFGRQQVVGEVPTVARQGGRLDALPAVVIAVPERSFHFLRRNEAGGENDGDEQQTGADGTAKRGRVRHVRLREWDE